MQYDAFTQFYGADAFDDPRNWVGGQFKPRKRVARDRETVRVPMQFMDAASTQCGGFRRGYQFDAEGTSRKSQDDAARAYDERRVLLQNAWRKNHQDAADDDTPAQCADAAQARAVADRAWLDKKERLQNSWRMK
jgi:hypothetical protein